MFADSCVENPTTVYTGAPTIYFLGPDSGSVRYQISQNLVPVLGSCSSVEATYPCSLLRSYVCSCREYRSSLARTMVIRIKEFTGTLNFSETLSLQPEKISSRVTMV